MIPARRDPGSEQRWTNFQEDQLELLDGFHFHTLCEQNSDALEVTVAAVEEKFGRWLPGLKWLNLGGGHHITRPDYDRERLIRIIRHLKETYHVEVYLEPGGSRGTAGGSSGCDRAGYVV